MTEDGSPQPRISVERNLLHWAMERSGRSVDELSKRPQLSGLGGWLSGSSRPTLRQLEKFADATFTPFGYLLLPAPPREQLPIPLFRTLAGSAAPRPSPDLVETVQTVKRRQDWAREYMVECGEDPLGFAGSSGVADRHADVARRMREGLGMAPDWAAECRTWADALRKMRQMIEDAGIFVTVNGVVGNNTRRRLDPEEFRGFVLADEYAPSVFVNNADGKAAQMFTLAHGLAHVWLGRSAAFDLHRLSPAGDAAEAACGRIAAELLVPEDDLRHSWDGFKDSDRLGEAARHFKVSEIVAARRALDAGLVAGAEFDKLYGGYEQGERERRKKPGGGGSFYINSNLRVGKRFARNVMSAVGEGRLLYREAYGLTGLRHGAFEKFAARLGDGSGG